MRPPRTHGGRRRVAEEEATADEVDTRPLRARLGTHGSGRFGQPPRVYTPSRGGPESGEAIDGKKCSDVARFLYFRAVCSCSEVKEFQSLPLREMAVKSHIGAMARSYKKTLPALYKTHPMQAPPFPTIQTVRPPALAPDAPLSGMRPRERRSRACHNKPIEAPAPREKQQWRARRRDPRTDVPLREQQDEPGPARGPEQAAAHSA